jgi:serine/threonine protein kinase
MSKRPHVGASDEATDAANDFVPRLLTEAQIDALYDRRAHLDSSVDDCALPVWRVRSTGALVTVKQHWRGVNATDDDDDSDGNDDVRQRGTTEARIVRLLTRALEGTPEAHRVVRFCDHFYHFIPEQSNYIVLVLVMHHLPMPTLRNYSDRLRTHPPPAGEVRHLVTNALATLHAIHLCGVTHGDVHADNLLVRSPLAVADARPEVVFIDFGEAKMSTHATEHRSRLLRDVYGLGSCMLAYCFGRTIDDEAIHDPPGPVSDADRLLAAQEWRVPTYSTLVQVGAVPHRTNLFAATGTPPDRAIDLAIYLCVQPLPGTMQRLTAGQILQVVRPLLSAAPTAAPAPTTKASHKLAPREFHF